MSDEQPFEPDEPAQPPRGQVRLVMAAVVLLLVAVGIWGWSSLRAQWARESASAPTTTVTTAPSSRATPTRSPTPSVQVATPVTPTPSAPSTSPRTTAPPTTPAPTPTTTTRPPADLPRGARVCDGTSEVRTAAGTPRTSCTFAGAVRDAWVAAGRGDRTVSAHSTVTDQDYAMSCTGAPVTTCRGGNRAVVYLF